MVGFPAVLWRSLDAVISVHQAPVAGYVRRLRRARSEATPAEIIAVLEKRYVAAMTGTGAVVGGGVATSAIGPVLAVVVTGAETVVFVHTTALFALAVAEVHGIRMHDIERRRTLVLAVVAGEHGVMLVEKAVGEAAEHWVKLLPEGIPMSAITSLNKTFGRWFVTKYGRNQLVTAISRVRPLGMGAAMGAGGNRAVSHLVVDASRRVFGPPPATFPHDAALTSANGGTKLVRGLGRDQR